VTWRYSQSTGQLLDPSGAIIATGYSGHGEGVNDPDDQDIPNVGPIPRGAYFIGRAFTHQTCGPVAMRLEPDAGTDTRGRSGFLIHGDSASLDRTASHGCIILPRATRLTIDASDVRALLVTP
jgi:hypothetical protein